MADTPSSILLLRLQATGSNTNLWGGYLNTALSTLERAAKGYQNYSVTGDTTIAWANYSASNDLAVAFAKLSGSPTAAFGLTMPSLQTFFGVSNTTSYAGTLKNSGGTGITVPANRRALLYGDATDIGEAAPNWLSSYVTTLANNGDIVVKATLESAIAAASGLTAPFILNSAADTTPGYLNAKVSSSRTNAAWATANGGANETSQLTVEYLALVDGGVQSLGFTAVAGRIYWIPANTALTVTLPATIAAKDRICFVIGYGAVVTLDPNGNKLNSLTSTYVVADPQTLLISVPDTATSGWC